MVETPPEEHHRAWGNEQNNQKHNPECGERELDEPTACGLWAVERT